MAQISVLCEQILALSDERWYFRMNSGNERAGQDLATRTFDANKVHFTRQRQVNIGQREVRRSGTQKHTSENSSRTVESIGTAFVPEYETVVDEYYMTPQTHQKEFEQELANNSKGQRHVSDISGVRRETVKLMGDPWPLYDTYLPTWGMTLGQKRTAEVILRVRARPIFQRPLSPPQPTPPVSPRSSSNTDDASNFFEFGEGES